MQARNVAKGAVAKGGSCRGVFQALGWGQEWKLQGCFSSPGLILESGQMLTKGAGIETPFGNRRRWKREWLGRPGTWQKQVRQRVEAAGGFFKPWVFSWLSGHRPQEGQRNWHQQAGDGQCRNLPKRKTALTAPIWMFHRFSQATDRSV